MINVGVWLHQGDTSSKESTQLQHTFWTRAEQPEAGQKGRGVLNCQGAAQYRQYRVSAGGLRHAAGAGENDLLGPAQWLLSHSATLEWCTPSKGGAGKWLLGQELGRTVSVVWWPLSEG